MNKKAVSLLMPIYFIAILALTLILIGSRFEPVTDTPKIGETASAVYSVYAQEEALIIYAQQAAQQAVQEAIRVSRSDTFEQEAQKIFSQLLQEHPTNPIFAPVTTIRQPNHLTFRVQEDIILQERFGGATATQTTSQAQPILSTWPIQTGSRDQYAITSVFGKRDLESSPNHAGIDIRADIGTPVVAMLPGVVTQVNTAYKNQRVFVQSPNGWTCGYLHVQATVSAGDEIDEGQLIAHVVDDSYDPHLDIRCYNHVRSLSAQEARNVFGQNRVETARQQPTSMSLGVLGYSPTRTDTVYVDPYCLFTPQIQQSVKRVYEQDQQLLNSVSGLHENRREGSSWTEKLDATCPYYTQKNILASEQLTVSGELLERTIQTVLQRQSQPCKEEPVPSYYEITQEKWETFFSNELTSPICEISLDTVYELYIERYLVQTGFETLPIELLPALVDTAAMHTPEIAQALLLQTLYVTQPEIITQAPEQEDIDAWKELAQTLSQEQITTAVYQTLTGEQDLVYELANKRLALLEQTNQLTDEREARIQFYRNAQNIRQAANIDVLRGIITYQFGLEVQAQITQEQTQQLRDKNTLYRNLGNCLVTDEACIRAVIHPTRYEKITSYPEQLRDVVHQCQSTTQSCSCLLPLPKTGTVVFNPEQARYNQEVIQTNWVGGSDEEERTFFFVLEQKQQEITQEEETADWLQANIQSLQYQKLPFTTGISDYIPRPLFSYEKVPESPMNNQILYDEETTLWIRTEQTTHQTNIYISDEPRTPVCEEQTVLEAYQNEQTGDTLRVNHRIPAS